jgi:hypothetical protein
MLPVISIHLHSHQVSSWTVKLVLIILLRIFVCHLTTRSVSTLCRVHDKVNEYGAVCGMRIGMGKSKYLEEICPSSTSSIAS